MATEERDSTADWIVPAARRPPSVLDLQRQIDVAMGVARAAEEAALEMNQSALEAAKAARDAAAHAERSAEASVAAARALADDDGEIRIERRIAPEPDLDPEPPADVAPAPVAAPAPARAAEDAPEAPAPGRAADAAPEVAEVEGHEVIPGSELPHAWSPVTPMAAPEPAASATAPNGSDPAPAPARPARPTAQPDLLDERMVAFRERAERVMARLQRLEAAPPVS
jgi:hypothetical protein